MRFGGFGLTEQFGFSIPTENPGDPLLDLFVQMEAQAKLVAGWFLPLANPAQHLTLNGAAVEAWAAAYGTQKVTLAEVTNPPSWDATLFNGKGGVVFDGTNDMLTGTGNVTNWPDATSDLYMLAATRQDVASGTAGNRVALNYGANSEWRYVGRTTTNRTRIAATAAAVNGTGTSFSGAHTVGAFFDLGGTSAIYFDGAADGTGATASGALTLTRVRMGAVTDNTPGFFWQGAIVAAAVLNSTATLADFLQLEAVMRGRLV